MADDPKPDDVWGYTYRLVTDEGDVKLTREDITYEGWAQIKAERELMRARESTSVNRLRRRAQAVWEALRYG